MYRSIAWPPAHADHGRIFPQLPGGDGSRAQNTRDQNGKDRCFDLFHVPLPFFASVLPRLWIGSEPGSFLRRHQWPWVSDACTGCSAEYLADAGTGALHGRATGASTNRKNIGLGPQLTRGNRSRAEDGHGHSRKKSVLDNLAHASPSLSKRTLLLCRTPSPLPLPFRSHPSWPSRTEGREWSGKRAETACRTRPNGAAGSAAGGRCLDAVPQLPGGNGSRTESGQNKCCQCERLNGLSHECSPFETTQPDATRMFNEALNDSQHLERQFCCYPGAVSVQLPWNR